MVNFYNFKILQQLIPFFVFFNAKNLCVSQNLLNTHTHTHTHTTSLILARVIYSKIIYYQYMPLSFFAEKKTRVFLCAGGTLKRNANGAKNANLRKMFARRGVLHTPFQNLQHYQQGVCNTPLRLCKFAFKFIFKTKLITINSKYNNYDT